MSSKNDKLIEKLREVSPESEEIIEELSNSIDYMELKVAQFKRDKQEAEEELSSANCEIENLHKKLDKLNKETQSSVEGEIKNELCQRLMKNLSLEQLENLEQVVKNQFKGEKKNYILELP